MTYDFEIKGDIGYGYGSKQWVAWNLEQWKGKEVTIRINSLGGDVGHALDIAQRFRDHGKVTVLMAGLNASSATIIAMGAQRVVMDKYGMFLIHQASLWQDMWGQMNADQTLEAIEELRKDCENLQKFDAVIASMYCNKSGKPADVIRDVMKVGGWLTPQETLDLGLIDAIVDDADDKCDPKKSGRAVASVQISNYASLKQAYGFSADLPRKTVITNSIHTTMTQFINKVLAFLGMEAIEEGKAPTDEQMDGAMAQLMASKEAHDKEVAELKAKIEQAATDATTAATDHTAAMDTLKAEHDKAVADLKAEHDKAVADLKAETEKTINDLKEAHDKEVTDLKAQITALQGAPATVEEEPQPEGHEGKSFGESAMDLYNSVVGML